MKSILNVGANPRVRPQGNDHCAILFAKNWADTRVGPYIRVGILLALSFLFTLSAFAETNWVAELEKVPVQQGGRVKPFESFAEEAARHVTGKLVYENHSATELVWRWMAEPEKWNQTAMIPIHFRPLRKEFGVKLVENKLSPEILLADESFGAKVQAAQLRKKKGETLTALARERISVYEKALLFREIATGRTPSWIANPKNPKKGWLSFSEFGSEVGQRHLVELYPSKEVANVNEKIRELLVVVNDEKKSNELSSASSAFEESLKQIHESRGVVINQSMINVELIYNSTEPFAWAWKLYLFAAVLFCFLFRFEKLKLFAAVAFFGGFIIHTYGFVLRCLIAGRPPVSNMYESIIWVSWAAVLFSIVIYLFYRKDGSPTTPTVLITAGFVGSFSLLVAESFPVVLNPAISPLVPVLRSNLWLSVHVLTITLSYGAFALAWGLGHILVFQFAFSKKEPSKAIAQYLYRALQIGVILLAAGTVLGGVWANYSWGRFWGWDPKETWALIALLGYIAVLHGRLTGWIRTFGLGVGAVSAFLLVIMAWYGVNFVLAAGLHSYGFGGGGAPYVFTVCLLDMALIGWASLLYKKRQKAISDV